MYNSIVKLWVKLWGCKMSKASVIKEILLYILNAKMTSLTVAANSENNLSKKAAYQLEMNKIKDLADKLEHSK
jgi:hypothetical protein